MSHRLTKSVFPKNYNLHIRVNLDNFTFEGTCEIKFHAVSPVDRIFLHSKNLSIGNVFLNGASPCTVEIDVVRETVCVHTGSLSGDAVLTFLYEGVLNANMEGFYRSSYKGATGDLRYMGVTQFEATDARQAFPCFDEPNFKASFDLKITCPADKTVVANTPVIAIDFKKGIKIVTFDTTPVMSTYLLAFVVSDLEYLERKLDDGKYLRAYCTPGKKEKLNFAIDVAARALKWYIDWFQIDYPLAKLDLLAVPDFSAGAMENWGLITFRESLIFCDENTDIAEKQDIVNTICHELAHQWFGNLVTMEWWTYLWLNESMATYFGWWVTDVLFPEYKTWDKFIDHEYATALELDSLESSHPIEVHVEKSSDIQQIFDAISYSKGSCLVRFLVNYLGEKKFRSGMQKYLEKNKYSNTVSADLWKAFGDDVGELMKCWTTTTGYPVVSVTNNGTSLVLSQERYYKSGKRAGSCLWNIPIEIVVDGKFSVAVKLDEKTKTFDISSTDILINPGRGGFFRVKYDKIPTALGSTANKNQLISDCASLCLAGYLGFQKLFDVLRIFDLSRERNYSIWNNVITTLGVIYNHLHEHVAVQERFHKTIMKSCYAGSCFGEEEFRVGAVGGN
ncbi:MAG: puromycin sensitive aminopeptidase [Harvfovirus sp.]|uniref:Puromycin sensitive aminopeptidase n=1 Tax=Harvfovirus sp. TaxID=2487768 RepID=A0A3G5A0L4_9VIRU|nr:MAG: puromycin sensitive aminopeptidase [Harvfovirus sp.]